MKKESSAKDILADKNNSLCNCPNSDCEWHGNCQACVTLHRYHATLPSCLEISIKEQKNIDLAYINED